MVIINRFRKVFFLLPIYMYIYIFYLEVTRSSGFFVLFCFCFLIIFRCYPEICKCTFPVLTPSFYHLTIREARLRLPWPDMSWCRLARWGSLGTITSGIVGKNFFFLFFFFFFISSGALIVGECPCSISGHLCQPCRRIRLEHKIILFIVGTYKHIKSISYPLFSNS